MTSTLISLISIGIGIIGANIFGLIAKKYSLHFAGNTLAGVFGSIFFIKSVGRLGFNPYGIMQSGEADIRLLIINFLVSFIGGAIAVFLIFKLKRKLNK